MKPTIEELTYAFHEINDDIRHIRNAINELQDGEARDYLRALLYRKGDALKVIKDQIELIEDKVDV